MWWLTPKCTGGQPMSQSVSFSGQIYVTQRTRFSVATWNVWSNQSNYLELNWMSSCSFFFVFCSFLLRLLFVVFIVLMMMNWMVAGHTFTSHRALIENSRLIGFNKTEQNAHKCTWLYHVTEKHKKWSSIELIVRARKKMKSFKVAWIDMAVVG